MAANLAPGASTARAVRAAMVGHNNCLTAAATVVMARQAQPVNLAVLGKPAPRAKKVILRLEE